MVALAVLRELQWAALLVALWLLGRAAERGLGVSPLLGQIVAGTVLGPALLDVIPHVDALRLAGKLGGARTDQCSTPCSRRPRTHQCCPLAAPQSCYSW